jgi:hypothetical protein
MLAITPVFREVPALRVWLKIPVVLSGVLNLSIVLILLHENI